MPAYFSKAQCNETLSTLKDLIRIDTTNPPGNEIKACEYLAQIFKHEGIEHTILESAPQRGNIIARIKGDGSKQPLLLTSHLDVVPVERDKWSIDPFAAEERNGFLYGRGAIDMKNMTALALSVFLKLKRDNIKLKRDLIFAAVADEEMGCEWGSKWLVDHHPELIRAEYALNEVGGFSLDVEGKTFYPIGVAEKGVCWFKIKRKGDPGHGAMPHDNQALPHVCLAAHKLAQNELPFHASNIVKTFIHQLAERQKFPKNLVLNAITNPALSGFVLNNIIPDKVRARNFKNMLRNLATPTVLHAGTKTNVIPSEAEVLVDGRILPQRTVASFLAEVQDLIGPGFEIEVLRAEEACETDYNNNFFESLKSALIKNDPGSIPVPFLIPGYTDAKHYNRLGIKCFGFVPLKLPKDLNFGALYHGHDERIPLTTLEFGLNTMWDVILETCL